MSGITAVIKQNLGMTNTKLVTSVPVFAKEKSEPVIKAQIRAQTNSATYVRETNPIILKNAGPPVTSITQADDVNMDNPINNSVLIYNETDEQFHLDQLSLDGGDF
jgi:hypothetical protein